MYIFVMEFKDYFIGVVWECVGYCNNFILPFELENVKITLHFIYIFIGTVNLHPSLLPLYRGAAPVQRALQVPCPARISSSVFLACLFSKWSPCVIFKVNIPNFWVLGRCKRDGSIISLHCSGNGCWTYYRFWKNGSWWSD